MIAVPGNVRVWVAAWIAFHLELALPCDWCCCGSGWSTGRSAGRQSATA
jgi:hypothetical protein